MKGCLPARLPNRSWGSMRLNADASAGPVAGSAGRLRAGTGP